LIAKTLVEEARSAPGRGDLKLDPLGVVLPVLAQRAVRQARNVERRAAVIDRFALFERATTWLLAQSRC
jgi:hypothetical protein